MSISKLKTGKYQVRWNENGVNRKRSFTLKKTAISFDIIKSAEIEKSEFLGPNNNVDIEEVINYFKESRDKKPSSAARDETSIKPLMLFFNKHHIKSVSQIDKKLVGSYEIFRRSCEVKKGKTLSQRTINIEISTLKAILNHASKRDLISVNPIHNYELPKTKSAFKRYLTVDEIDMIFSACDTENKRLIVYALLTLGLRSDELCQLQYSDFRDNMIHLGEKTLPNGLKWSPKWSKERFIDLGEDYANDQYLCNTFSIKKQGHIFLNDKKRPYSPNILYWKLKRLIDKSGIQRPEEISTHSFRHTHITYMVARGVNVRSVMENVGIRDYETLYRYSKAVKGLSKNIPHSDRFAWQPETSIFIVKNA